MSALAQQINDGVYDAVEVAPVRRCDTEPGEDWTEDDGYEQCERDDSDIAMWSVYLHLVEGGVECVADCPDEGCAIVIAGALQRAIPQLRQHGEAFATSLTIFTGA